MSLRFWYFHFDVYERFVGYLWYSTTIVSRFLQSHCVFKTIIVVYYPKLKTEITSYISFNTTSDCMYFTIYNIQRYISIIYFPIFSFFLLLSFNCYYVLARSIVAVAVVCFCYFLPHCKQLCVNSFLIVGNNKRLLWAFFFLTYYLPLQLVWQSSTRFFCFQFIFTVSFTFCLFTFIAPAWYLCITSTFHATIPHAPIFTKFMFRRGG